MSFNLFILYRYYTVIIPLNIYPYTANIPLMKSTIKIPQDKRHRHVITLPIEIWEGENLTEGDLIEIDIKKIERKSVNP